MDGCSGDAAGRANVPRPEPEGANDFPAGQLPRQPHTPSAYDNDMLTEDEKLGLLKDDMDVAIAEVELQPSVSQLAPESLLPAKEETPQLPLIGVGRDNVIASASLDKMSSDTALSPSQTSVTSQTKLRLVTDTADSYADTVRDSPLTKMAIKRLQRNRLRRQTARTSTDDDKRKSFVDSGRHFPSVVRKSVSPESDVTLDTLSPGRSSTSTFLLDSESSDTDVGAVRTLTLRSIAKMKRKRSKKSWPNILVTEPEPVVTEPGHTTTPMSVRTWSRSRTPRTQSSIDKARSALSSPHTVDVTSVPPTPSPSPFSDHIAEVQPDSQTAQLSRAATPAGEILPGSPAVPVTQPTPATTEPTSPVTQQASPVMQAQADQTSQPVPVSVAIMKDVQKVERTDAEGQKSTVYKLTPKAGSMFPAPVWPAFAAPSNLRSMSLDQRASGDQAPTASIRLNESRDVPAIGSLAGARLSDNRRSTGADQQTLHRLKTFTDQRGDKVLPHVMQEIQGVSAQPQIRSAGLAQVTSLREPLVAGADVSASFQDHMQFSAKDRLSYAPFGGEGPHTVASSSFTQAFDHQLSDVDGDIGLTEKLLYTNSLSNFPYLSGERSHTDLNQRANFNVSVSDATNAANIATSQFLRDHFSREKKCFKGLTDGLPKAYLNGVLYEGLQPETQSLLSRISKVGIKPKATQQSELQRIRSSFSLHSSDQQLSQAKPDYPQQPSSSKLEQVGHRLSFLPSAAAQPDEYLHPSVSKITPKPAVDMSKPDDFLHPSLHRITSTLIPARPDDALHASEMKLSQIANYDEALHPSLSRLQTKGISQAWPVPAKLDDHLHPSLTRVQLKPSGPITSSGKLRTDLEKTTTTTTVVDREYFQYDEPARPDDSLHPSSTRIVPIDESEVTRRIASARGMDSAQFQSAAPAKPDDIRQPSSTRLPVREHARVTFGGDSVHPSSASLLRTKLRDTATATSTTSLDRKESLRSVPARTDDILHPSSTQFPPRVSARGTMESATSTTDVERKETLRSVPARTDDILHPSSTQFPARSSARSTMESATSTTDVDRKESLRSVPARTDDILHPSSTQFPQRVSARGTMESTTSTNDVEGKEILRSVPARTDDILHPSSTHFPSRVSARGTMESATSTTDVERKEVLRSVPARTDDILHPSSTQFPPRVSARATMESATSTTDVERKESLRSVPARTDDILHPSSTQFPPRVSAGSTTESATSTTDVERKETSSSIPVGPTQFSPHERAFSQRDSTRAATSMSVVDRDETSTEFQQRDVAQASLDTSTSTAPVGRRDTFQSGSARPDDTIRRSSTHGSAASDSTVLTTATDRKESLPVSATSGGIIRPSQFSSRDSVRDAFDSRASRTNLDRKGTLTSVTSDQDDVRHPSFIRESARAGSVFDTGISTTTLPDAGRISDDVVHPRSSQLMYRDSSDGTFDAETSTTAFDWKETLPSVSVRPDGTLHPARTQFSLRDSGQSRATLDTATSTTALGTSEVLPPVSARPDDILHPSSTKFPPRHSARTTLDTATSTTALDRKERLPPVPARPDDILHPSAAQLPQRDSARGSLDAATSVSATAAGDMIHPSSTQFRASESMRASMDTTTSTTALNRHESILPLVPARPDDISHPSSTHFTQRDSTRGTLDTTTSTVGLDRKETFPSVPARPDDVIHPSSTQVRPSRSTRGAMDSATSTTSLGRKETYLPLVPARPDDIRHPSVTQFPQRVSAPSTATSTAFDSKETPMAVRADDFGRHDNWESIQSEEWMEDTIPATDILDTVRSSRRSSDLRSSEIQYGASPSAEDEASYPSEFMHPSLTEVGKDKTTSGRSSSVRTPDQEYSEDASVSRSQLIDYIVPQDDIKSTEYDRILSDRQSITATDEHIGQTGLPSEVPRSSMQSVSRQRQTVPSAPATVPDTPAKVDSNRQRRVTWALGPRTKSAVDAKVIDSVSSISQRSLPGILDSGGPSRALISGTSPPSSTKTDLSYGSTSRKSTTSDVTTENYIHARDSRTVTREHMEKKKQQKDIARSDECSYDVTKSECRRDIELEATEDEPMERAGSSVAPRSSERTSTVRVSEEAAAADADDVSLRQEYTFDPSCAADGSLSSSVCDFHQFAETEDWLLESPSASVSRAPCTADRSQKSLVTDADEQDAATICTTTSRAPCHTTLTHSSCQSPCFDVTTSRTYRDVSASGRTHPTSPCRPTAFMHSHATRTSRVREFSVADPCRQPPAASRMFADRSCYSRTADVPALRTTRYGRDYCPPNMGYYQNPFARRFVQSSSGRSWGSTYCQPCPPCQPTRQAQQVYVRVMFTTIYWADQCWQWQHECKLQLSDVRCGADALRGKLISICR